ncbi:MAG: MazG nucleotide pyrophosphohydrolase domain-containing protein [Candidatus Saccharimonas sp.]
MTINELQHWVREDWENRSKIQPSTELQLLYIIEEFGEVAEAIRKNSGAKDRKDSVVDLGSELADLLVSITTLANSFDVDLEHEIAQFKVKLDARHQQGF